MLRRLVFLLLLPVLALPVPAQASGYVVRTGDTLSSIAVREHTTITTLIRANRFGNPNLIRPGMVLYIPNLAPRASSFTQWYHVRWGDTLIGIGLHYGLNVAAIHALNPRLGVYPLAGQWLRVCSSCSTTSSLAMSPSAISAGNGGQTYTVHPGDSLIVVASRFGTTVSAILTANGIGNANLILAGSHLAIPNPGSGSAIASIPITSAYDPWGARALIVASALQFGVPASLALAIGWQESGFNQNLTSSTGAIGVMQVEPYTVVVVDRLLGRTFDLYRTDDNIAAGVYWLSRLLRSYNGNQELAVAAYYQGSNSVASHGYFDDTVQYVRSVLALQARFS